jgi:hypothetical protein
MTDAAIQISRKEGFSGFYKGQALDASPKKKQTNEKAIAS